MAGDRTPEEEAAYTAHLAERAKSPEIQAFVNSCGPLAPEALAVIARVFNGVRATPVQAKSAAPTEESAA